VIAEKTLKKRLHLSDINNPELEKIIGEKPANKLREELELISEVYPNLIEKNI
jgi:peptide chain release factor 3